MAEQSLLTVTIKNTAPVELIALAESLDALGKQYISFTSANGIEPPAGNVRLYIDELRTGSIIAVLKTLPISSPFWSNTRKFSLLSDPADDRGYYDHDRHWHADPGARAVQGGMAGAGVGAAIGCVVTLPVGCAPGAAVGAAVGGGTGAVAGAASTPPR